MMIRTDVQEIQKGVRHVTGVNPIETYCCGKNRNALRQFHQRNRPQCLEPAAMLDPHRGSFNL
jgi:hypothetical protein